MSCWAQPVQVSASLAPLWKSFLLRLYGQSEQLKKSVVSFLARFYNTWELVKSGQRSLSDAARHLFGLEAAHTRRPKPGAFVKEASEQVSLERDYFNLRKMIVVSTLEGSVYGLHSEHGLVLWSLHLGSQFEPMVDQFGVAKVPLLIQRSTAHYQFSSQAAVVFHLKVCLSHAFAQLGSGFQEQSRGPVRPDQRCGAELAHLCAPETRGTASVCHGGVDHTTVARRRGRQHPHPAFLASLVRGVAARPPVQRRRAQRRAVGRTGQRVADFL